jgi:two-component sensor histidine kinase
MNGELCLTVADNGVGIRRNANAMRGGLGSKLVENFARQLGARHEIVSSEQGTTHDLVIPKVA